MNKTATVRLATERLTTVRPATARHAVVPQLAGFRVLVVPGLNGSGASHWQTRWQRLYPAFERVEQEHWERPELAVWSARLQQVLAQRSSAPNLIVAHSFGCLTTVHRAIAATGNVHNIAAALLVAPADPVKFEVASQVQQRLPFPSMVVASSNDPWMQAERARHWAQIWGSEFVEAGALGHINADSGLGDWLQGQDLLCRLASSVAHAKAAV